MNNITNPQGGSIFFSDKPYDGNIRYMNDKAKKIMDLGWKARENLEFDKAEKLLNEAKTLFEESADWFNVTEVLNHLAYTEKLKAVHHNLEGMKYAKQSEKIAEEHLSKKTSVLRALMSLADSAGLFEQALKWGYACLEEMSDPLPKSDILSHIATFQLRTGNILEAEVTISEAEALMDKHLSEGSEPHLSIWRSKILATKGLILYNKGDTGEAKKYLTKALDLATEKDLKTRQAQIKSVMELF